MITAALLTAALQAGPPPGCMDDAARRAFDFWVGRWNAYDQTGAFAGENTIVIGSSGCVLHEHWRNAGGGDGHSLNFVDPDDGRWRQVWVGRNHRIDYAGGLNDNGQMVLTGEITYFGPAGVRALDFRGIWTPLENGHLIQHFQQYDPDADTWTDWALLTYVPDADDPNGPIPAADDRGPVIEAAPDFE